MLIFDNDGLYLCRVFTDTKCLLTFALPVQHAVVTVLGVQAIQSLCRK